MAQVCQAPKGSQGYHIVLFYSSLVTVSCLLILSLIWVCDTNAISI